MMGLPSLMCIMNVLPDDSKTESVVPSQRSVMLAWELNTESQIQGIMGLGMLPPASWLNIWVKGHKYRV